MINVIPIEVPNQNQLLELLANIQVDPKGQGIMLPKMSNYQLYLTNVPIIAANIIKQECLSKNGEAAVHKQTITHKIETSDILISLNQKNLKLLINSLKTQDFKLAEIALKMQQTIQNIESPLPIMPLGSTTFDFNLRSYIMGIINMTPDSFSDGGQYNNLESAIQKVRDMITNGADIIDIGGESTKPGSNSVSLDEELSRTIPLIKAIRKESEIPISIDTTKHQVAKAAIEAGANIVNDISGLTADPKLATVCAQSNTPIILMHILGTPLTMQNKINYDNLYIDIYSFLEKQIDFALSSGINPENILLDPGIGFGKTTEHNLILLNRLKWLKGLGKPIVSGFSRKRFIGEILKEPDAQKRTYGNAAAAAISINNGANIIRVHDVKEMKQTADLAFRIRKETT